MKIFCQFSVTIILNAKYKLELKKNKLTKKPSPNSCFCSCSGIKSSVKVKSITYKSEQNWKQIVKFYMAVEHMYCLCNSELFQIQGMKVEGQTVNRSSMYGWQQNWKYLWIHKTINYLEDSRRAQVYGYSSPLQREQIRVREQNAALSASAAPARNGVSNLAKS